MGDWLGADDAATGVEWLILADAAQVVGGKLYMLGGGWTTLVAGAGFPLRQRCAFAAAFRVPWSQTNLRHDIRIELLDEDGRQLFEAVGQIEVGRPAGLTPGQAQRSQMSVEADLVLERPGTYVVQAQIGDTPPRRVRFDVVPGPMALPHRPPMPGSM